MEGENGDLPTTVLNFLIEVEKIDPVKRWTGYCIFMNGNEIWLKK